MNENPLAPVGDMLLQAGALAVASYAATTVKRIVEPSPVERFAKDARRIVEDFHRELVRERARQLRIPMLKAEVAMAPLPLSPLGGIPQALPGLVTVPKTSKELIDVERRMLANALARHGGNQSAAARDVGVERKAFARRCKKLKVK